MHPRLLFPICLSLLAAFPARAAIEIRGHPRECVSWAAARLGQALRNAGVPPGAEKVIVRKQHGPNDPAETFNLTLTDGQAIVTGTDARGEMYGVLELAERIENSRTHGGWADVLSQVEPTRQSPFLAVRADNPFIHIDRNGFVLIAEQAHVIRPPVLFADLPMWERYIDMLAANRFNTLDLHGGYNLSTTRFLNLLPLLVSVDGYPKVGDPKIQRRNLGSLRHIIRYARKRGIEVGMMNYSARFDPLPQKSLEDYTTKAVATLLRAVPELRWLGFRVGESSQDLGFYEKTYLKGVENSGRHDVTLYTRNWKAAPKEIDELAAKLPGPLDVEIKFNGEHLGLPYQALLGPAHSKYSYDGFLDPHAHYRVLWQIRANGTHRFWTWAESNLIRRTVRACRLGNALGFTLEPHIAYFPTEAAGYYRAPENQITYRYIWEKNWPWYFAWGRLAYDPDLPPATITANYVTHFGPTAGELISQAMEASGAVVSLAMAYRFTGPDQRNMSPETQTSAFDPVKSEAITPLTFAMNTPMDPRSFVGIDEFVRQKREGHTDGRIGPVEVVESFLHATGETIPLVSKIHVPADRQGEWGLLKADIVGASGLGNYYSARILGTMYLDYALQTGSQTDYDHALHYLEQSRSAWTELALVCDATYAPLENPLVAQEKFTWHSQIDPLARLDATIPAMWKARGSEDPAAKPLVLTARDRNSDIGISVPGIKTSRQPNGSVVIACQPSPAERVASVTLWKKGLPSDGKWSSASMSRQPDGSYTASAMPEGGGLLCLVEVTDVEGHSVQLPSPLKTTPYWVVMDEGSGNNPDHQPTGP